MFFRKDLNLGNRKSESTLPQLSLPLHIKQESHLDGGCTSQRDFFFYLLVSSTAFICFCLLYRLRREGGQRLRPGNWDERAFTRVIYWNDMINIYTCVILLGVL